MQSSSISSSGWKGRGWLFGFGLPYISKSVSLVATKGCMRAKNFPCHYPIVHPVDYLTCARVFLWNSESNMDSMDSFEFWLRRMESKLERISSRPSTREEASDFLEVTKVRFVLYWLYGYSEKFLSKSYLEFNCKQIFSILNHLLWCRFHYL